MGLVPQPDESSADRVAVLRWCCGRQTAVRKCLSGNRPNYSVSFWSQIPVGFLFSLLVD